MARLNIYLPDELAAQARQAGLNVSALSQEAVRRSVAALSTDTWLAATAKALPASSHRVSHDHAVEALDAIRDEAPTRHG
ncbi:MAG: type II toxin-antitoxin system CcdA family antitoxin [Phycicoccus sp.]